MIPVAFDYVAPESVEDALAALAEAGDDGKVIAGGQSLLPVLRMRLNAPEKVIDLSRIANLRGVCEDGDDIVVGAMPTHHEVANDPLIREHATVLAEAASTVADPQIRHRGTLGGALAHADPAGDLGAPVLALDAELVVTGMGGERRVPATEFFTDLFETAVGDSELLTAIRIPKHTGWGSAYEKFVRVSHQWSIVGVAAVVKGSGGTVEQAKIGLTNMGSTPLRATAAEAALAGASGEAIAAAAAKAADGATPPSDLNGASDYRAHLAQVLTRRAVERALGA